MSRDRRGITAANVSRLERTAEHLRELGDHACVFGAEPVALRLWRAADALVEGLVDEEPGHVDVEDLPPVPRDQRRALVDVRDKLLEFSALAWSAGSPRCGEQLARAAWVCSAGLDEGRAR